VELRKGERMNSIGIRLFLLAFGTLGLLWLGAAPAQAQLSPGCSCPAGLVPLSGTTCTDFISHITRVPAICPLRNYNVGQIAASQQQQSFWGVNQMLQHRRDQLQYTPVGGTTGSGVTGYASSELDANANALPYAARSKTADPFAGLINQASPAQAAPVIGTWIQGIGDWEHDNPLTAIDLGRFTSTYTAQGGVDRTIQGILSADDALVFGIVSSATSLHSSFANSSTSLKLEGPGVGAYSEYVRGGFSTDVTAKFDFLQLTQDFGGVAPNASVSVLNSGVSGNVQYKFMGTNNGFFEPTMGFSLTHTSFGSGGAALNLEDAYTVRLQAGARFGTTWDVGHGVTVETNLKALAYGNAVAQGTAANSLLGGVFQPIAPTDEGLFRGELDPELCFNLPDDYSLSLSGQVRFGEAIVGGTAAVNLRKQW
jgi:hypothetical protein